MSDFLRNNKQYIDRMVNGESLIRIGHIWYGIDTMTTFAGIGFFPQKNVETIRSLRVDAAMAFSRSMPAVNTIRLDLVVHYSKFASHVQELEAATRISPVLPVVNPAICAMVSPTPSEYARGNGSEQQEREYYAKQIMSMHIDNITIETMIAASQDIRVIVTMTRVLDTLADNTRNKYVRDINGAVTQENYIQRLGQQRSDDDQVRALGTMFGINSDEYQNMITAMEQKGKVLPTGDPTSRWEDEEGTLRIKGKVLHVNYDGTLTVKVNGSGILVKARFRGIQMPWLYMTETYIARLPDDPNEPVVVPLSQFLWDLKKKGADPTGRNVTLVIPKPWKDKKGLYNAVVEFDTYVPSRHTGAEHVTYKSLNEYLLDSLFCSAAPDKEAARLFTQ